MKILITTGGTAGHIFPALATIEALYKSLPDVDILFVGTTTGLEKKIITQASIAFKALPVQGFMGKGFIRSFQSTLLLVYSFLLALKILIQYKPAIVVGFGGYASLPSLLAAKILRKPILLHEQNAVPGSVTRLFAPYVQTLCVGFQEVKKYFSHTNVIYTGNPIRSSLQLAKDTLSDVSAKRILVMGGSLGAMKINTLIVAIMPFLLDKGFVVWHQTGMKHYAEVQQLYEKHTIFSLRLSPFIEDMQEAYEWADFVICRAGASTITELSMMALPAIFIPFPYAVHNHQYHNAQSLVNAHAALCLEEATLTESELIKAVEYISTPSILCEMKKNIYTFAQHAAADNVAQQILHCGRA